jgi:hypothetical protein
MTSVVANRLTRVARLQSPSPSIATVWVALLCDGSTLMKSTPKEASETGLQVGLKISGNTLSGQAAAESAART